MHKTTLPDRPRVVPMERLEPTLRLIVIVVLWCAVTVPAGATQFVDMNPDDSGAMPHCPAPCQSGGSGGRVNGLAPVPGDPSTFFAASELGGLFKTTNGGDSWFRLDDYVPTRTWDVVAAPGGLKVYATSFYDGRAPGLSLAGLQVSEDGGLHWSVPPLAPPAGCLPVRSEQPSAFGIAIRPGSPDEVLVGTNCGIQRTSDGGDTWAAVGGVSNVVWDVLALPGGLTYACGEDGFLSSPDGVTWTTVSQPEPGKSFCALAVSPDESDVVFAVFAVPTFDPYIVPRRGVFYESDDGGATWSPIPCLGQPDPANPGTLVGADCPDPKRTPIIATNKRSQGFDLWLGAGNLYRVPCVTPTSPGSTAVRCTTDTTQWSGTFTDADGDISKTHGDSGDLEFDLTTGVDACPTLYSSDGGIYRNALTTSPDCHDPDLLSANVGVHALLLLGMDGVDIPGADEEDLYMALQDCGLFSSDRAGAATPSWAHGIGGDVNDVVADDTRTVTQDWVLKSGDPGFTNMVERIDACDWGYCTNHNAFLDIIAQSAPDEYLIAIQPRGGAPSPGCVPWACSPGVQITTDIEANPKGSPLGTWPTAALAPCHVQVSNGTAGSEVFALAGQCVGRTPDELWRFAGGTWSQVAVPTAAPGAGFALFAVDPMDADRLYAVVVGDGDPRIVRTLDGGTTWVVDDDLNDLLHGVRNGRRTFTPMIRDSADGVNATDIQTTLIAFDPEDPDLIVAGGRESGVFISSDGGESWALLTDPYTPGSSGAPHLPRPAFAHFDHDSPDGPSVFIGTVGRGVWRVTLDSAELSLIKSDEPDPVAAGSDLTYTIEVTNTGPEPANNLTVEDVLPPGTTYASHFAPQAWSCESPPVGSGGRLRCTSASMPVGSTTLTAVVHVPAATPAGELANTARAFSASVDANPADNTATETTTVIRRADLEIVSSSVDSPPPELIIGQEAVITLRKVLTNHGPSAPVDAQLVIEAIAEPGATVTPSSDARPMPALELGEQRSVEETFTIGCLEPGAHSFLITNEIGPSDPTEADPDPSNNRKESSFSVECVVPVVLDIKPRSNENPVNLGSEGEIPTAVLTTAAGEYGLPLAFDATTIDPLSTRFGTPSVVLVGGGASESHGQGHLEDVPEPRDFRKDRDLDMVLHFGIALTGLDVSDTEACVRGIFVGEGGGRYVFFGCDSISVTP